jgi:hypothetical protein
MADGVVKCREEEIACDEVGDMDALESSSPFAAAQPAACIRGVHHICHRRPDCKQQQYLSVYQGGTSRASSAPTGGSGTYQ